MQLTAKIADKIHFSEIGSATLWTHRQCWLALVSLEKLWNGRKVGSSRLFTRATKSDVSMSRVNRHMFT